MRGVLSYRHKRCVADRIGCSPGIVSRSAAEMRGTPRAIAILVAEGIIVDGLLINWRHAQISRNGCRNATEEDPTRARKRIKSQELIVGTVLHVRLRLDVDAKIEFRDSCVIDEAMVAHRGMLTLANAGLAGVGRTICAGGSCAAATPIVRACRIRPGGTKWSHVPTSIRGTWISHSLGPIAAFKIIAPEHIRIRAVTSGLRRIEVEG